MVGPIELAIGRFGGYAWTLESSLQTLPWLLDLLEMCSYELQYMLDYRNFGWWRKLGMHQL